MKTVTRREALTSGLASIVAAGLGHQSASADIASDQSEKIEALQHERSRLNFLAKRANFEAEEFSVAGDIEASRAADVMYWQFASERDAVDDLLLGAYRA